MPTAERATAAPTRRPARVEWIDTAKGLAITLVVFGHVMWILLQLELPTADAWRRVLEATSPMRMPGFFLMSGLFVHRLLDRPRSTFLRQRVGNSLYLYGVWVAITIAADHLMLWLAGDRADVVSRSHLVEHVLRLETPLWYLVALAAFHLLWYVTRHLPVAMVLTPSALLWAGLELDLVTIPPVLDSTGIRGIAESFVFFLVGARRSGWVRGLVERLTGWSGIALIGVWLAVEVEFPEAPLRSLIAVPALFAAAQLIAPFSVGRLACRAGRRTLPLYLMNWLTISVVGFLLVRLPIPVSPRAELLLPALVLPLVIAAMTLAHRSMRRWAWLWSLPRRTSDRASRRLDEWPLDNHDGDADDPLRAGAPSQLASLCDS